MSGDSKPDAVSIDEGSAGDARGGHPDRLGAAGPVSSQPWQALKSAFREAVDLSPEEKARYVEALREGDDGLARELETLLAAAAEGDSVLDRPPLSDDGAGAADRLPRVGPYEVLQVLGEGGMGTVCLARRTDGDFAQLVALKVVRGAADSPWFRQRFRVERQILAGLVHPNIARLYDGGTTADGLPYLVMEYVDGEPIVAFCDRRRLAVEARLRLFLDVCSAVQYAHAQLVVHRDLKPGHVLVTPAGVPKLVDFGLATLVLPGAEGGEPAPTAEGGLLTPEYASPEHVEGKPTTPASDVYSLGAILYELLSGRRPHRLRGRSFAEVAEVVCRRRPEPPSLAVTRTPEADGPDGRSPADVAAARATHPRRLARRLAGELDGIVLRALEKVPAERYGSVEAFAEDVRRHLEGLPVSALPGTLLYRARKLVARHRLAVAAGLLIAFALAGSAALALREARVARLEADRAARRFQTVRELATRDLFSFHDAIRSLPGATAARAAVLKTAVSTLDSLAREAAGDPGLARELADAYCRLGDVADGERAGFLGSHLGDGPGAVASYRKAVALLAPLAEGPEAPLSDRRALAGAWDRLGLALVHRADVAGEPWILRAHALRRALTVEAPGDRALRADLARSDDSLAAYHEAKGNEQSALAARRAQVRIFGALCRAEPGDLRLARELALARSALVGGLRGAGDLPAALEEGRRGLELATGLLARSPESAEARLDVVHATLPLVAALREAGEAVEALELLGRARALAERAAADDPADRRALLMLSSVLRLSGDLARASGDLRRSHADAARAVALLEPLHAADSAVLTIRNRLITAWTSLAETERGLAAAATDATSRRRSLLAARRLLVEADRHSRELYEVAPWHRREAEGLSRQIASCDAALAAQGDAGPGASP